MLETANTIKLNKKITCIIETNTLGKIRFMIFQKYSNAH